LPDSDGFKALKALRNGIPKLPAIIMTANGSESIILKATRAEAADYICKPIRLYSLKQQVSEILKAETDTRQYDRRGKENKREISLLDGTLSYIEEHYTKHLTLDMLAHKVNMNKFKFCKTFKAQTGQTFISYLNNVRIRNAMGLLEKADLNITEIAYGVGYKSIVHFDRVFKEAHGVSPREYRKKFRNTKGRTSQRQLKKASII
jgi:YesN/AraC family two-component response regulator